MGKWATRDWLDRYIDLGHTGIAFVQSVAD
jgi:hypothetical protein